MSYGTFLRITDLENAENAFFDLKNRGFDCCHLVYKPETYTKEAAEIILSASEKQLIFLSNQYKEEYADFSDLCDGVAILLQDVNSENVIYARDLRYIACTIADGYIHLCQAFSL